MFDEHCTQSLDDMAAELVCRFVRGPIARGILVPDKNGSETG